MQQNSQPKNKDEEKDKQMDKKEILGNQRRFDQVGYFRELFQKDLDQEQRQILVKENVYDLADFFYKIDKTFFKIELDKQKFDFFKFLSGFLKMDEEKLMPILKKLHENKLYSQQAFTQAADFKKIGVEQQIIEKIQNEIIKKQPIVQNSNHSNYSVNPTQIKQLEKQHQDELGLLKKLCKILYQNQKKIDGQQKLVYQYPIYDPKQLPNLNDYKSILVIGQKGSGKTSFLNYLLNIYLGVALEDDFRFIFENSDQSTNDICVRYIQKFREKPGLKLIDTPGFIDDLDHKKQPNQIEKIFSYLQNDQKIDCICFVLDANIIRLTSEQNLLFEKVVRNFGESIFPNLKFIFTQCTIDGQVPRSIQAIKFKGDEQLQESPFAKYLDQMTTPIYFKVNCQNIHSQNNSQDLQNYYWNMTYQSISDFYVDIFNSSKQSIKFAYPLKQEKQKINIQELLKKACEVKVSLKGKTKLDLQQQQLTKQNKIKLEEQDQIKKSIIKLRNDFSIYLFQTKQAIQNYYELFIDKTKTIIEFTEELKGSLEIDDKTQKKIFINIIEDLQVIFLMEVEERKKF